MSHGTVRQETVRQETVRQEFLSRYQIYAARVQMLSFYFIFFLANLNFFCWLNPILVSTERVKTARTVKGWINWDFFWPYYYYWPS